MKFSKACELVGFYVEYNAPKPLYTYFAYKDGEAKSFPTLAEASKFSSNTEKVQVNKDEVKKYHTERAALESKAIEVWQNVLRQEYSYLSDGVYNLCYSRAYDQGHASGYDEVANCMYGIVDFAERIIKEYS